MEKTVQRIVITGASAEERRQALQGLRDRYQKMGYVVFTVPSSEEELQTAGVTRKTLASDVAYAWTVLDLQLSKATVYIAAAELAQADKVLVLCNGGCMDGAALVAPETWQALLDLTGVPEVELRDGYSAVFVLESEESARAAEAWAGHPHLRIASDATLTQEVDVFLGEPEPVEIERKYLIEYPDTEWLEAQPACRPVEIEQAYLTMEDGEELRVRRRGAADGYVYFETIKRGGAGLKRTEIERRLTKSEYDALVAAAREIHWIRKTRWCLVYKGQYLEIDIYPFWDSKAVLEAELLSEDQKVEIPPEIRVIKEVTGDPDYTNYALSLRTTPEK